MSTKLNKTKDTMMDLKTSIKEVDENLKEVLEQLTPEQIKSLSADDIKNGLSNIDDIEELSSRLKEVQEASTSISDTLKDNPELGNSLENKMGAPKQKAGRGLSNNNRASKRPSLRLDIDDPDSQA